MTAAHKLAGIILATLQEDDTYGGVYVQDDSDGKMTAVCIDGHVNLVALANTIIERVIQGEH